MQSTDLQVIKEIPGYKVILKTVLKSQIQQLVEQLADHTGEESVILTASVSDGSLSHLGSESGKVFLEDHDDIKSQFLGFCLKRHHKQKQLEKEKQQQELQDPGGQMMMTTNPPRYGPGPRPRFAPSRVQTSTRQISPGSIHPVSLTRASPQSGQRGANVRHEPYPGARPKKPVRFDPQSHKRLSQSSPMQSPSETVSAPNIPSEIIKTEPKDNHENAEKSSAGSGIENSVTEPNLSSADNSQPPTLRDEGSESSSSTIINEPTEVKYSDNLPPGGLSLDPDFSNFPRLMDTSSDSAATDPNVNIKVEAVADSDDLEITGVEPGQMAQPDYGMMPNLQSQMGYDPSLSSGAQGSVGDPSSQGYRNYSEVGKSHTITNNQAGIYRSETGGFETNRSLGNQSRVYGNEGGGFGTNSSLDNHSGVYGNEGGGFGTNSSLDNHSGVYGNGGGGFGTNATGFECDICGKIIVTMSNLRRHRRLHTGEKPFTCGTCDRKFSDGGNFTKHLRTFGHVKVAKK